jgi:hypothetical protein
MNDVYREENLSSCRAASSHRLSMQDSTVSEIEHGLSLDVPISNKIRCAANFPNCYNLISYHACQRKRREKGKELRFL